MNGGEWRIRKRREKKMINGNMVRKCGSTLARINEHSCIYMTIKRNVPHFVIFGADESNSLVRYDHCSYMHILHDVSDSLI